MTVAELEQRLTSREFVEWGAFLKLVNERPEDRALREAKAASDARRAAAAGAAPEAPAPASHTPAPGALI